LAGFFKTKRLKIFFIQSTASTPQEHGIKTGTEQEDIITLLQKKTHVLPAQNTDLSVIFLTPRLHSGAMNEKMLYPVKKCYHTFFKSLKAMTRWQESSLRDARICGASNKVGIDILS
jgi:hypothetical protein